MRIRRGENLQEKGAIKAIHLVCLAQEATNIRNPKLLASTSVAAAPLPHHSLSPLSLTITANTESGRSHRNRRRIWTLLFTPLPCHRCKR
uniref:Uncharacterized protein n=1 Tax=Arundo donax TaxID=35708 RepID=A0A0A8Y5T9_ARUDO